jgi:hypothetical protein
VVVAPFSEVIVVTIIGTFDFYLKKKVSYKSRYTILSILLIKVEEMTLQKYSLPNGNTILWLGKGGVWGSSDGLDNVMILTGGDVLFLKTIKTISLRDEEIREDLQKLSYEEFIKKYEVPDKYEVWDELKRGIQSGEYPTFMRWLKSS